MAKRLTCLVLAVIFTLALCPMASADDIVGIDKVNIETYPTANSSYNDLPTVGQQASVFHAGTITAGVQVTGCSLVDDNGNTCTGTVENKNYTIYVTVSSQAINYVFNGNTKAFINGVAATISPSGDGQSATISRYIKPNIVDPVIYKNPTDENHDKSSLFSFTASASQVWSSFQWYIMTTYGEKFTPEELSAAYPGVTTSVKDIGNGAVRLNIGQPLDDMSGWLVYCIFYGYSGTPVATNKATMTIKGAKPSDTKPSVVVVDTDASTASGGTMVDGVYVPDGITIVETPAPSIEIVETPEPTVEIAQTPEPVQTAEPEQAAVKDNSKLLTVLKWAGIVIGAIVVVGCLVLFVSYLSEKKKAERRRKMSGRYKGRH